MPEVSYKLTPQGGVALTMDNRENAKTVEMCYKTHTTTLNPIVDWDDAEVWEFIKEYKVPYCELYDQGFKRLGCIGCPMGSREQREREFERWPKYKKLYLKAFEKLIENRGCRENYEWQTAEVLMQGYITEHFIPIEDTEILQK